MNQKFFIIQRFYDDSFEEWVKKQEEVKVMNFNWDEFRKFIFLRLI